MQYKFKRLNEVALHQKTVLIRTDMNVPMQDGEIRDDSRICAALPSIQYALAQQANVIIMSHLGRPTEGALQPEESLAPIAKRLAEQIKRPVILVSKLSEDVRRMAKTNVILLENVRGNVGEKANRPSLGQAYALLADVFVNDAFGAAHRAEASTHAVAQFAETACAGFCMASELDALSRAWLQPARPLVAIVGGAKVSSKLPVLMALADRVDHLIVGGGIANTFLLAAGYPIGQSLAEPSMVDAARRIMEKMRQRNATLPLPTDVVVGRTLCASATAQVKLVTAVAPDERILDIGPQSSQALADIVTQAATIIWNGPVGAFEIAQFSQGTQTLAAAIAKSGAFSMVGGGDTIAAVRQYGVAPHLSYISTGGGAFLQFFEGKPLPAVQILENPSRLWRAPRVC